MSQSTGAGGEDAYRTAKQKVTIFAQKKGLLSDKDFNREDMGALLGSAEFAAGGGRVVDIHDHDPTDSIYAWDFDSVNGSTDPYFITNPDPTDPLGGGHG